MNGAQSGHMLETYVFAEVLKSYLHNGDKPNIFFYRNTDQKEIDFIIEKDMTLYPIEVKKTANPNIEDCKSFKTLSVFKKKNRHRCYSLPIRKNNIFAKQRYYIHTCLGNIRRCTIKSIPFF
jgi:predicted AAA+ superfamily ATPase